ncbi:MAG: hypothetical protein HKO56_07235 [Bacteroidia bacterium]|nr:hypothetical protein [Bacteroidia bacterium]NNM16434.1 hypothetical protein [Bacteroidia bacterium]
MKDENYKKEMQELENEAPTLFGIPKKNNFTAPEGYFDRLPSEISEKISAEPPVGFMEQIKEWLIKPQMALASLALLIGISAILYLNDANKLSQMAAVSDTELEELTLLAEAYSEEDLMIESLLAFNDEEISLGEDIFTDEDIENYLADTEHYLNDYLKEL